MIRKGMGFILVFGIGLAFGFAALLASADIFKGYDPKNDFAFDFRLSGSNAVVLENREIGKVMYARFLLPEKDSSGRGEYYVPIAVFDSTRNAFVFPAYLPNVDAARDSKERGVLIVSPSSNDPRWTEATFKNLRRLTPSEVHSWLIAPTINEFMASGGQSCPTDNILFTGSPTLNKERLDKLMTDRDRALVGEAAKSEDAKSLYEALALMMSDKRFPEILSFGTKQEYQTKSISLPAPINIDPNTTDIGGGSLVMKYRDKNGQVKETKLSWDANHFTKMGVQDWLWGSPKGPSNGHVGFIPQLNKKKIISITPPTTSAPSGAASGDHLDRSRFQELMTQQNKALSGDAAKSYDAKTLYEAIARLMADKRLPKIVRVRSKQEYLTKGISDKPDFPIQLDPESNDIGGGSLLVTIQDKGGQEKTVTLSWDANHLAKMEVQDWLWGSPNGPSNGHVGFFSQLNDLGLVDKVGLRVEEMEKSVKDALERDRTDVERLISAAEEMAGTIKERSESGKANRSEMAELNSVLDDMVVGLRLTRGKLEVAKTQPSQNMHAAWTEQKAEVVRSIAKMENLLSERFQANPNDPQRKVLQGWLDKIADLVRGN